MTYYCSACHRPVGRICNREGRLINKEGQPNQFYCPNTGRMATVQ